MLLTGVGAGIVFPVFPAVAIAAVPPRYAETSGAAANAARQFGITLGIAVCGTVGHSGAPVPAATGVRSVLIVCDVVAAGLLRTTRPGRQG